MRVFLFCALVAMIGANGALLLNANVFPSLFSKITAKEQRYIEHDLSHTFRAWIKEEDPSKAGIVVRFPSGDIKVYSHGGLNLKQKRPVASLSKAVTGLCIAGLIMDNELKFTDRISSILADYFAIHGVPKDEKIQDITIAHLLTHRSGVYGNSHIENSAFYDALSQTVLSHGVSQKFFDELVPISLSQDLVSTPGSGYNYSNTNYLVLGLVIEQVTNQSYEDYCSKRVLKPAGVSASIDADGKILSSFAGWLLSPLDMIKIFSLYDPANGFLTEEIINWNSSPHNKNISANSKHHYGLGVLVDNSYGDDWYFHAGKWNKYPTGDTSAGSLAKSYRTLAFYTDEGVGVFAVFEPGNNENSSRKLRSWMMYSYERGLTDARK